VKLCYFRDVKNITVTVPDEVYRRARVRAAEQGRSVSALVAEFLSGLSDDEETRFARLEALQDRVLAGITDFNASDRLTREQLHDRSSMREAEERARALR
jgi:plasmid stability protein